MTGIAADAVVDGVEGYDARRSVRAVRAARLCVRANCARRIEVTRRLEREHRRRLVHKRTSKLHAPPADATPSSLSERGTPTTPPVKLGETEVSVGPDRVVEETSKIRECGSVGVCERDVDEDELLT